MSNFLTFLVQQVCCTLEPFGLKLSNHSKMTGKRGAIALLRLHSLISHSTPMLPDTISDNALSSVFVHFLFQRHRPDHQNLFTPSQKERQSCLENVEQLSSSSKLEWTLLEQMLQHSLNSWVQVKFFPECIVALITYWLHPFWRDTC